MSRPSRKPDRRSAGPPLVGLGLLAVELIIVMVLLFVVGLPWSDVLTGATPGIALTMALTGALAARRRPAGAHRTESLGPELRRLAWSAAFLLTVAGTLLASGLYH